MIKALYGTRSGRARWHDRLFDILQELKFKPSKSDPCVRMRPEQGGTCYEYIAVYVDDLAIAAKDPQAFCHELKKKYNLKLEGVGPLEYHLGCTYKKELQIPEGMSIISLNLTKGCSRRNQESPDHHLDEEIIMNLIHLNFVMNIKPNSFKH